ncbi:hypothetical protein [Flavobacterium sp.]|uniref:hypothetical protein n=1 Tax=Flavobacterium sp. TaxID=239 RepID=UPI003752DE85
MRKLITVLILFCFVSCKSQETQNNNTIAKNNTMEYFDENDYNNLTVDNNYSPNINEKYYVDGNKKIRIIFREKTIQVEKTMLNNPYEIIKIYFKNNKILYAEGQDFYGIHIGLDKEYDETGKLIKQIDNDKPYQFSIEDLRKKLKNEYDIDIIEDYNSKEPTLIKVGRWLGYDKDWDIYKKNVPMYQIGFEKNNNKIYLEINATTGSTIKKKVNGMVEK